MKKTILFITAVICALTVQSCLKNQVDYFEKTASARMSEALENARNAIYSSPDGWKMEYFTGYGGYNFAVKFIETDAAGNQIDSVCATSELAPSKVSGSFFRLTSDDGPVLSLDTYNDVLHFFATPDWGNYRARGGDFEFIILSATPDEIVLKGKRSGLISKMYPIERPETMHSYVEKMAEMSDQFLVVEASGMSDDVPVKMEFDLTNRNVRMLYRGEDGQWDELNSITVPYLVTADGIRFEHKVEFLNHEIEFFTYNKATKRLLADDEDLVLKAADIPSDYTKFKDFAGTYEFKYGTGASTSTSIVTLEVADELSRIMQMKGFTEDYEGIYLYYNASSGRLQFLPQYVGVLDEEFPIAAFSLLTGNGVSTSATMDLVPNPTPAKGFKFVSTPGQKSTVTGYVLFKEFEDEDGETDYDQFYDWKPNVVQFKTLVRK